MTAAEVMTLTTTELDRAIERASCDLKLLKDIRKAKATQETALAKLAENAVTAQEPAAVKGGKA
jgi:hypothetical protein